MRLPLLAISFLLCAVPAFSQDTPYFHAPAGREFARVNPGGTTILPNGRFVTPKGERLYTGENLWNVAVSPNGKTLVGFSDNAIVIYTLPAKTSDTPRVIVTKDLSPVGVFTKDGTKLIVSNGDSGNGITIYDTAGWDTAPAKPDNTRYVTITPKPLATISANAGTFDASYINDIALSPDEKLLYGVDVAHQRVVVFDLVAGKVLSSTPAGREPYALTLSDDGKRLFIANIGLFNYSLVGPSTEANADKRGLSRPPFGFPTKESEEGVVQEGRKVAGLGKPQVPDAQSIWAYDVTNPTAPVVTAKATAGLMIHAPADAGKSVGGSAPNKLLLRGDHLFVSNANNDTVQIFDATTLKSQTVIKLAPSPLVAKLRGVIPSGMVLNRDGTRLYVSESGLNAVAVIDTAKNTVIGHIPTGWFPVQLALAPDEGKLFIGTQKGVGRGPRGPKQVRDKSDERFWPVRYARNGGHGIASRRGHTCHLHQRSDFQQRHCGQEKRSRRPAQSPAFPHRKQG